MNKKNIDPLMAISPVDGRYREKLEELSNYFSEYSLIKYRLIVEIKWLIKLFGNNPVLISDKLNSEELSMLDNIISYFDLEEARKVKEIESITNHDVKAIEYYIRDKFKNTSLERFSSYIHFGCTSEDISNLAYSLMISNGINNIWIPNAKKMLDTIKEKAIELRNIPMLSHTHGQPASPTTVGKEFAIFVYRWNSILDLINNIKLKGKFSGAVGNFNAHSIAFSNLDWIKICKDFVESLDLEFNPLTTQIESHDILSILFKYITAFNNITMDFNSDMWIYISKGYFKQKVIKTEVGSSVMPHKVNPINYENSMANIRISNSILDTLSNNLTVSRMQRDLSDSSALRNIGVGISHSLLSIIQTLIRI